MPTYRYEALTADSGNRVAGSLTAASEPEARRLLGERRFVVVSLIQEAASGANAGGAAPARRRGGSLSAAGGRGRATARSLALFTRQLAALLRAGLPLVKALELLSRQREGRSVMAAVAAELAEEVRGGSPFSQALARHPRIFDRLWISVVRAGEAAGSLGEVLERLALYREKSLRLRRRLRAALAYPVVVLSLSLGIVGALAVFVVPRFQQIYAEQLRGASLPALTELVLALSRAARESGGWALAATLLALLAATALLRTERGRRSADAAKLALPAIGPLLRRSAVARASQTLSLLLSGGVPLLQALLIARDTAGNAVVAAALDQVHERVKRGDRFSAPLQECGVFPDMAVDMIAVGEEAGDLTGMLRQVSEVYEEEVDANLSALTTLVEPTLLVLLAALVGGVVLALFLPLIQIVQRLGAV